MPQNKVRPIDFKRPRRDETGPFSSLFVTDIDGTLIDRSCILSDSIKSAMDRLRSSGWDLAVATGRILGTAVPYMDGIGTSLPAIVYDGGRIMDRSGRSLWEIKLDSNLLSRILEEGWGLGMEVQLMADEVVRCHPDNVRTMAFFESVGVPYVCNLTGPDVTYDDVFRVMFYDPSGNIIESVASSMRNAFGGSIEVVQAGDGFLDVLPPGVSKGSALGKWLELMDRKYDKIVAVGDNENDLELLKWADYSVAISTAPEDLLEVADKIIAPPEKDGMVDLVDFLLR